MIQWGSGSGALLLGRSEAESSSREQPYTGLVMQYCSGLIGAVEVEVGHCINGMVRWWGSEVICRERQGGNGTIHQ